MIADNAVAANSLPSCASKLYKRMLINFSPAKKGADF
jgi:hypothetical protein